MTFWVGLVIGLIIGGLSLYAWMRNQSLHVEQELVELRASHQSEKREKELLSQFFEKSTKQMQHEFKSTAGDLFQENVKQLQLDNKEHLKPLMKELERLHKDNESLKTRHSSFSTKMDDLQLLTRDLSKSTVSLSAAMKGGKARGRWAEMALRNVLEMSQLTEGIDYEEQLTTSDGLRPDFVVRLPGHGFVAIDSKAPADDYLLSLRADDEAESLRCEKEFVKRLRSHLKGLANKDYSSGLEGELDFTVLFLPGDGHLATIYRVAPEVLEESWNKRVVLASPTTLMAMLRVVALQWQHHRVNEELSGVNQALKEFYKRLNKFESYLSSLGNSLDKVVKQFNSAVGSYKSRLLPFEAKLPSSFGENSSVLEEIEERPRQLNTELGDHEI
tara:strand:+ start:431 stop:1594 length:1164 start_codon:yes stop_codon:yes gene_type:complete